MQSSEMISNVQTIALLDMGFSLTSLLLRDAMGEPRNLVTMEN